MFTHYLRSTWRTIRRNPLYSLVSMGCLAIGIAVSLTIMLYVLHEYSYDRWQARAERIYSVTFTGKFGDNTYTMDRTSLGTGPQVLQADPQVESYLRVFPTFEPVNIQDPAKPEQSYTEYGNFAYADSNFFSFFSLRLKRGDRFHVLNRPHTLVITERAAKKYFGDADPVGRTLRVGGQDSLEITGVAANPPSNTDLQYDFLASTSSMATISDLKMFMQPGTVSGGAFRTWFLLKAGASPQRVVQTIGRLAVVPGQPEKDRSVYSLIPLTGYHLNTNFSTDASGLHYLRIFPLVAGLILLLALVNYMSLSTARAAARAKEVGVRKVLGAGRKRIAGQFYVESAGFALLSFGLGLVLFLVFRPYFLNLLHLSIDASFLLSPLVLTCSGGLLVLVILVAGSYPSLVLSAFRPVAVLYGKLSRQRSGERVRKGFIVFQFTISMSLVLCSWIIQKELHYLRHTDTGVDRDNVVMIPFNPMTHYTAFKNEMAAIPGIGKVAGSHYGLYGGYDGWLVQGPGSDKPVEVSQLMVDDDFIPLLGLQWDEKPADGSLLLGSRHVLLNQAAVAKLDLQGDPVGQRLKFGNSDLLVGGVLKDFVYADMRKKIGPLVLTVYADTQWIAQQSGVLLAKINAHTNIPTIMESMQKVYRRFDQQTAFDFHFLDEVFDNQYRAEDRLAGLFGVFTLITIVIACLGLFALATFSAQQRVREIGIRKVLGASVASIGALLSRDFLRPVLLAIFIACPLSWWAMSKWLDDFAYRTPLSWWVFAGSGLGLLLVALGTVLVRSLRAGRANPVDNLRSE